jgi:hypothetical protein
MSSVITDQVVHADEVVEAARVYGPTDPIPVTDPNFVPEGFHEKCRDETGGIRITEQNKHLFQDIEHLIRIHKEEGWATEKGITYTCDMSRCPDGRAPTHETLTSMKLMGLKLKGRIIMVEGNVMDCDTENSMETLGQEEMIKLFDVYREASVWERHGGRRKEIRTPGGSDVAAWMDMPSSAELQGTLVTSVIDPEPSITITEDQSFNSNIPVGEYHLKDITTKKNMDGLTCYSMCDEPECCLMSHVMMMGCAGGSIPQDQTDSIMKFFRERKMYKTLDPINGNFDICYRCIKSVVG